MVIRNTIVEVRSRPAEPREVDRTISKIAERIFGIYSPELRREADPRASEEYIASDVRRLEAMRHDNCWNEAMTAAGR
jgi:hypothetical protein